MGQTNKCNTEWVHICLITANRRCILTEWLNPLPSTSGNGTERYNILNVSKTNLSIKIGKEGEQYLKKVNQWWALYMEKSITAQEKNYAITYFDVYKLWN